MVSLLKRYPLALILTATAFFYLPVLRYDFVYDDQAQILWNSKLLSWNFSSYFLHHVWIQRARAGDYYRPLFLLWLRLNYALFHENVVIWHITAVLLHLSAVVMVYLLLRRTIGQPFVVAFATAVFALHPCHAESVAWVSGAPDPLMTIPLIGALLCWIRSRDSRSKLWVSAALALMVVALLAKETAAITPALIALYAYALSEKENWRSRLWDALRAFIPFALVFAVFWAMRTRILRPEQQLALRGYGVILVNIPAASWFYLKHLLLPVRLSVFYDFRLATWSTSLAIAGVLVILALVAGALLAARFSNHALVGWVWIWLPIVATFAGIRFFDRHDCVHDRYLYVSTIGLGILAGLALEQLQFGATVFGTPLPQLLATVCVLAALGFTLLAELPQWKDEYTLYERGIQIAPNNVMPYQRMAVALSARDHEREAVPFFLKALSMEPNDYISNVAMGQISFRFNDLNDSVTYCERANALQPKASNVCYMFQASALNGLGRPREAEALLRIAIEYWPMQPGQHVLLGQILEGEGDREGARHQFLTELQLNPNADDAKAGLEKLQR